MSRPDEALIHAWLDGELDAAEAARIAALVESDAAWAAAAAEARGLIAASARILGALDDVPANVLPETRRASARAPGSAAAEAATITATDRRAGRPLPWWAMRVAALLVVATGTVLVVSRTPDEIAGPLTSAANPADVAAVVPIDSGAESSRTAAQAVGARKEQAAGDDPSRLLARQKATSEAENRAAQAAGGAGVASVSGVEQAKASTPPAAMADRPAAEPARRDRAELLSAAGARVADSIRPAAKLAAPVAAGLAAPAAAGLAAPAAAGLAAPAAAGLAAAAADERKNAAERAAPVASPAPEECYREAPSTTAGARAVHRVGRTSDTTAVPVATRSPLAEVGAARTTAAVTALRVRGDTLFLGASAGGIRIALRITCPAP